MEDNSRDQLLAILRVTGCVAILPNVPFWIASHYLGNITRPAFNLDYLAVALAGLFLPKGLQCASLFLVLSLDLLRSFAGLYYFSQTDLINAIQFLPQTPWRLAAIFALVAAALVLSWALFIIRLAGREQPRARTATSGALVCLSVLLVLTDGMNGTSSFHPKDSFVVPRLANSTLWSLALTSWKLIRADRTEDQLTPLSSATVPLLERLRGVDPASPPRRPPNIVIVIVESYGLIQEPQVARILTAPYLSAAVRARYTVQVGAVAFSGATVSGEFRELCGVQAGIKSITTVKRFASQCLPDLLKQRGYRTEAVHGFTGYMFYRRNWYKDLGFDEQLFLEDLRIMPDMRTCGGPFPGICDVDIAGQIGKQLASSATSQLIYWVTLNSHLPLQLQSDSSRTAGCGPEEASTRLDPAVCQWFNLIDKVNVAVARLAARPDLPKTEFFIVGDHAPPFFATSRRNQFSQTTVPFIHLQPLPVQLTSSDLREAPRVVATSQAH